MKYNVGDRVRIKSIDWYNENKDNYGSIYAGNGFCFWKSMARLCGEIMKITSVKVDPEDSNKGYYFMENSEEKWTDEMIEGLVEEEVDLIPKFGEYSDNEPLDVPTMTTDFVKEHGLPCPEGYQFVDENGNVINTTKIVLEKKPDDKLKLESTKKVREYWSEYTRIFIEIYDDEPNECILTHLYTLEGHRQKGYGRQALIEAESIAKELGCHTAYLKVETNSWMHEWYLRMGYKWYKTVDKEYIWLVKNFTGMEKKKKEYPKTYEECYKIMGVKLSDCYIQGYKSPLLEDLQELLIYRDAYWKIAGEEMGLDGPWEPDWNDTSIKYCLERDFDAIDKNVSNHKGRPFAFPTAEMRDAFKENFDPDIEICKEFL